MKSKAKIQLINQMDLHALEPLNVSLLDAEVTFYLIKDGAKDMFYFGRLIAKTRISRTKQYFQSAYDVSLRPYQAPTCLDHDLAFLAVNMAQVQAHDFVYDPFVGSASTLISAAHFKAVTFGSDLDLRVL